MSDDEYLSRQDRVQRFVNWLDDHGVEFHPDTHFRDVAGYGSSLFTRKSLPSDTVAVKVPSDLVITPQSCRDSILQYLLLVRAQALQHTGRSCENQTEYRQKLTEESKFISPKNFVILYIYLNQLLFNLSSKAHDTSPLVSSDISTIVGAVRESVVRQQDLGVEEGMKVGKAEDVEQRQLGERLKSSNATPIHDLESSLLRHSPYILMLPGEFLTPLHFSKVEVLLLRGTPLFHATIERVKRSSNDCQKTLRWFYNHITEIDEQGDGPQYLRQENLSDTDPTRNERHYSSSKGSTHLQNLSRLKGWLRQAKDAWDSPRQTTGVDRTSIGGKAIEAWKRAETSYGSRAFPPSLLGTTEAPEEEQPDQKEFSSLVGPILIPGLDTLNHERGRKVTWSFEVSAPQTNHSGLTKDVLQSLADPAKNSGSIVLTLHDPTSEGSQVFNNYGAKSNEEFLGSYGFVNSNHDDDSLTLVLGDSSTSSGSFSATNDHWGRKHYWSFSQDRAPESLLTEMKERLLSIPRDPEDMEEVGGDGEMEELRLKGEVLETLEVLLLTKRKNLKSTEKENEHLIAKAKSDRNFCQFMSDGAGVRQELETLDNPDMIREEVWRMVSVYREGQRVILDKAVDWTRNEMEAVEDRLEELEGDEG